MTLHIQSIAAALVSLPMTHFALTQMNPTPCVSHGLYIVICGGRKVSCLLSNKSCKQASSQSLHLSCMMSQQHPNLQKYTHASIMSQSTVSSKGMQTSISAVGPADEPGAFASKAIHRCVMRMIITSQVSLVILLRIFCWSVILLTTL